MKQAETISLEALLPKGIRVRKGKKGDSLVVQTRKQVKDAEGNINIIPHFKTVPMKKLPENWTSSDYEEAFVEALEEAKKEKVLALKHIAVHGLEANKVHRTSAVGTLGEVYDLVFKKRWENTPQEQGVKIYAKDIFAFFPKSIRMDDMQTHKYYDDFIVFMEKRILERPANNHGTFKTSSTNRRLGVIRVCIAYAIEYGLLDAKKVLNTNPNVRNFGWKNLSVVQTKDKNVLSKDDETRVIAKIKELGDEEFADEYAWLIDVGMRYETEFITFTIKDIDWKNKKICFWRNKTQAWSANIPLTKRAFEIATRYRDVAMTRTSQRLFSHSKHKLESLFKKYKEICKIEDHTPYITRRTFGTRLGERGILPKFIARLMGNSPETCAKYYIQPTKKGLERAILISEMTDEEFDLFFEKQTSLMGHNSRHR